MSHWSHWQHIVSPGPSPEPVKLPPLPKPSLREAFEKLAEINFTPPSQTSTAPAAEHAPPQPAGEAAPYVEPSPIERAKIALADRLRRSKQDGKRPSRAQAYKWCHHHGHAVPFIRFKTVAWPEACSLAKVPEWTRGGRIPSQQLADDFEI